jgi:hypothetical protein
MYVEAISMTIGSFFSCTGSSKDGSKTGDSMCTGLTTAVSAKKVSTVTGRSVGSTAATWLSSMT